MGKHRTIFSTLLVAGTLFFTSSESYALNAVEQLYSSRLASGSPDVIKSVSSSIVVIQGLDREVYDVAAEVLFRDYKTTSDELSVDALAWVTKVLLTSRDGRYIPVLLEVSQNSAHEKLKKYAKSTASKLKRRKTKDSETYTEGMIDLASYENEMSKVDENNAQSSIISLAEIKVGMSYDDVNTLIGSPTSSQNQGTGKFSFSGREKVRTTTLYKGQGAVIFESAAYTGSKRVVEVVVDLNESGVR